MNTAVTLQDDGMRELTLTPTGGSDDLLIASLLGFFHSPPARITIEVNGDPRSFVAGPRDG